MQERSDTAEASRVVIITKTTLDAFNSINCKDVLVCKSFEGSSCTKSRFCKGKMLGARVTKCLLENDEMAETDLENN